jgi:hypothetical protein
MRFDVGYCVRLPRRLNVSHPYYGFAIAGYIMSIFSRLWRLYLYSFLVTYRNAFIPSAMDLQITGIQPFRPVVACPFGAEVALRVFPCVDRAMQSLSSEACQILRTIGSGIAFD